MAEISAPAHSVPIPIPTTGRWKKALHPSTPSIYPPPPQSGKRNSAVCQHSGYPRHGALEHLAPIDGVPDTCPRHAAAEIFAPVRSVPNIYPRHGAAKENSMPVHTIPNTCPSARYWRKNPQFRHHFIMLFSLRDGGRRQRFPLAFPTWFAYNRSKHIYVEEFQNGIQDH